IEIQLPQHPLGTDGARGSKPVELHWASTRVANWDGAFDPVRGAGADARGSAAGASGGASERISVATNESTDGSWGYLFCTRTSRQRLVYRRTVWRIGA